MAEDKNENPFNLWWVAAGILLVLVLIAAGFIGLGIGRSATEESAPRTESASDQTPVKGETGECSLDAQDQEKPGSAPDVTWKLYAEQVKLPTSEKLGPGKQAGKFWQCWAHSPKGAVLAGIGLVADFTFGGVKEAANPSDEREEVFESQQSADASNIGEVRGFKLLQYDGTTAKLSYLLRDGTDETSLDLTIEWNSEAGDWRLALDKAVPEAELLYSSDVAGYTTWGTNG